MTSLTFLLLSSGLCLYFHIEQQWIYSWQNLFALLVAIFYVAIGVFITVITLAQSLMSDIHPKNDETKSVC